MKETPSFVSQPHVIDLPKLLDDVKAGHIQIPRFQRPFVWEDERRVELLRSLRTGIPIGSLLVWRTSQIRLSSFEAIAGVKIPRPVKGQYISYLLDGHQRLTTLFAAFQTPSSATKKRKPLEQVDDEMPAQIFFDLTQDDFVVGNPSESPYCLPLHLFLDAVATRQHFRKLERDGWLAEEEIDGFQAIAEGVLYAMQWCRIPVIPLSTDDIELATRTFHRVNSQGVPMTEFHMVAALTWREDFDLRARFEAEWGKHELPEGWSPGNEQQTLNVLKGLLNMDLARSPSDLLVRRVRDRPALAERAVDLLARAITLSAENFARTPVGVPYQLQLVLTAVALDGVSDDDLDFEWLRRWWGLTTVWGSFASAATHRVQAALRHLRAGVLGKHEVWPDLLYSDVNPVPLPNLDLRNARARYFVDGYAASCGKTSLLAQRGPRAIISLLPKAGSRVGNRFIWPSEKIVALTEALEWAYEDELEGHFIDSVCLKAWADKDYETFLLAREKNMNKFEERWFRELDAEGFVAGIIL